MLTRFARLLSLAAAIVLVVPLTLAADDVPKQDRPTHRVVRITGPEARRPAEVSVAINPLEPTHLVAVSTQAGRPGEPRTSNHAYSSEDGGKTWKSVAAANPDQRVQGDDAVAFGPDGTAYHSYIAFNGNRGPRPLRASTGIFITSSRDGLEWTEPVPVVDHVNTNEPFEDKPWLVLDHSGDSPHRGNLYVSWTRFDVYGSKDPAHKSHIFFARSRDGGKTFEPAARISDEPGNAVDDSNTLEGAVPAVGPKGEVYVAWSGPKGILIDKSTDGGWSFGKDVRVAEHVGGWDFGVPGLQRHNGMPVAGVDRSRGKNHGSVYVAWIDRRNGDPDVFVAASRDGGTTWSEPVRVNDDPKGNGVAQLFTWMAVDPSDGSLNLVFYDRRGLKDTQTGVTVARSVDGGKTFVNYKVDQEPFAMNGGVFFGDYIGIAAHGGRVVAVYMHFIDRQKLALSAALFRFRPGSQSSMPPE